MNKEFDQATALTEKKGMIWISSTLKIVSETWQMPFRESKWEVIEGAGEKTYSFIIEGQNKKRAMKLFTKWELQNCASNSELQGDLQMRLLRMLSFVSPLKNKRTNELQN